MNRADNIIADTLKLDYGYKVLSSLRVLVQNIGYRLLVKTEFRLFIVATDLNDFRIEKQTTKIKCPVLYMIEEKTDDLNGIGKPLS